MMKALCPAAFVLALPVEGQIALWDMRADPPFALAQNLPDGVVAGRAISCRAKS